MGEVLKVSSDSKPKAVAGALAAVLRAKGSVELQAVGAGAVNQAVKAIAIARGFVAPNRIDLVAIPAFTFSPDVSLCLTRPIADEHTRDHSFSVNLVPEVRLGFHRKPAKL
jgi:stage V sporulation protein S